MATAKKAAPAAETSETKDLATVAAGGALATADDYSMYEEDSGSRTRLSSEDVSIPFLEILQSNSPECQGEDGARPGQIVNRTTGEIFSGKTGITVLPVDRQHLMVEWRPREAGGGVVAQHSMDSDIAKHVRATQPLGKYKHPAGMNEARNEEELKKVNDLIETFYVYVIVIPEAEEGSEPEAPYPAVLAFSSTKIKPYKDWMFRLDGLMGTNPETGRKFKWPWFAHRYRLTTETINKNNYTWCNWIIRFDGSKADECRVAATSDEYQLARTLKQQIADGTKVADTESLKREDGAAADEGGTRRGDTGSEKAPY